MESRLPRPSRSGPTKTCAGGGGGLVSRSDSRLLSYKELNETPDKPPSKPLASAAIPPTNAHSRPNKQLQIDMSLLDPEFQKLCACSGDSTSRYYQAKGLSLSKEPRLTPMNRENLTTEHPVPIEGAQKRSELPRY